MNKRKLSARVAAGLAALAMGVEPACAKKLRFELKP